MLPTYWITPLFRFYWTVIVHKAYVLKFGLRTKASLWRLLIHDYTKFGPSEALPYALTFYGTPETKKQVRDAFNRAWLHHQSYNPHHWQHWLQVDVHKDGTVSVDPLPMPDWALREMVADWLAASTVYSGKMPTDLESWVWWNDNRERILLHEETVVKLYCLFAKLFGGSE